MADICIYAVPHYFISNGVRDWNLHVMAVNPRTGELFQNSKCNLNGNITFGG